MKIGKGMDDLVEVNGRPRIRAYRRAPAEVGQRRSPMASGARGPVSTGLTLAQARETTATAIMKFAGEPEAHIGEALLVATPPGVGKTTALAKAIASPGVNARIVFGTRNLAEEYVREHGGNYIEARGARNCERPEVVAALGAGGHDVSRLACGTLMEPLCPFRSRCLYFAHYERPGHRVGTAEQLFNPRFLAGGNLIVLDDIDPLRSAISSATLTGEAALKGGTALKGPVGRARELLAVVCSRAPVRPLTGAPVWDHIASTAASMGIDLESLLEALGGLELVFDPAAERMDGVLTVEEVEAAPPATIGRVLAALCEESARFFAGEEFNCRLRIADGTIEVASLRPHVLDGQGVPCVSSMALLMLDGTPVESVTDHLLGANLRLPDVRADVALPDAVTVVQYATAGNGHGALQDRDAVLSVVAEINAQRAVRPVAREREAVICYPQLREQIATLVQPGRPLTFGSMRGSNLAASVERIHVVGRPWPPEHEVLYLAQVVHHDDEDPVSPRLAIKRRVYGNQPYAIDIVDFEDRRASAILRARRDDEVLQAIHRARLYGAGADGRQNVTLVLHTSHPIDGLRVDELHLPGQVRDRNAERQADARARIREAAGALLAEGAELTTMSIANRARADWRTVERALKADPMMLHSLRKADGRQFAEALGTPLYTVTSDLYNGIQNVPQRIPGGLTDFSGASPRVRLLRERCWCIRGHDDVVGCDGSWFREDDDRTLHCRVCHPRLPAAQAIVHAGGAS